MSTLNINNDYIHLNSASSDKVVVEGNLGIGTTNPTDKLHIIGSDSEGVVITGGTNGRKVLLGGSSLDYYTTTSSAWAMTNQVRKASDGSVIGNIAGAFGGVDSLTYTYYGGTAYNNAAMYIKNYNVGIGTNSPSYRLDVETSNDIIASFVSTDNKASIGISDNDTSIYVSAENAKASFGFNVGVNANNLNVASTGNVLIGTTTDSGYKLNVNGNIGIAGDLEFTKVDGINIKAKESMVFTIDSDDNDTARVFQFKDGGGNALMTIGDDGNVGIGTTSPSNILHTYVNNTDTSIPGILVEQAGTGDSSIGFLLSGVRTWSVGVDNSDSDKFIIGSGEDLGTSARMVVDTSGNVGVGTTSPDTKLEVAGQASFGDNSALSVRNDAFVTVRAAAFAGIDVSSLRTSGNIGGLRAYDSNGTGKGQLLLKVDGGLEFYNSASRLYITPAGNVGIGTTSPNSWAQLETTGTVAVGGILYVKSSEKIQGLTGFPGSAGNLSINPDGGNVGIGATDIANLLTVGGGMSVGVSYRDDTAPTDGLIVQGNVGIGDPTPTNKLDVQGSARIGSGYNNTTAPTNGLIIEGNVGIGTTNPGAELDVVGQIRQTGGGDYWYVSSSATAYFQGGEVTLSRSNSGYVSAVPKKKFKKFKASVAFKTTTSTHLGIVFAAQDAGIDDNNYAVILRDVNTVRVQKRVSGSQTYPISEVSLSGINIADGNWHTISMAYDGSFISIDVDGTNYISRAWTDTSFTGSGNVGLHIYDGTVEFNEFICTETTSKDVASTMLVSGNLGVGTTSPDQHLQIHESTSSGAYLKLTNSTTGEDGGNGSLFGIDSNEQALVWNYENTATRFGTNGTERMRVTSSGNVGIGTTIPSAKLQVVNSSETNPGLTISNAPGGGSGFLFQRWQYVEASTSYRLDLKQRVTSGVVQYAFDMVNNGTSYNSNLVLDRGNVGIGTTSPVSKQHNVITSSGSALLLNNTAGGANAYVDLEFNTYNVAQANYANSAAAIRVIDDGAYSGHITFRTKGASINAAQSEQVRITSSGNVGIGTTSPSGRLHLEGNFEANKALVLKGTYGTGTEYYFRTHGVNSEVLALYAGGTRAFNFRPTNTSTDLDFIVGGTLQLSSLGLGYLKTDSSGNVSVDNSTFATETYVTDAIANLVDSAPSTLDTLNELAAALGDDPNFATTVTNSIATKLPLSGGTMTGIINTNSNISFSQDSTGVEFYSVNSLKKVAGRGMVLEVDTSRAASSYLEILQSGTYYFFWNSNQFSITDVSNWNTAYSWGDHSGQYLPINGGTVGGAVTINGPLVVNGTITENSSLRVKENIITSEGHLKKVNKLRSVKYNKIDSDKTEIGLIAEEVEEVYPEFIQYDENGDPIGIHYSRLTASLIGAVKELTKEVEELKNKING